MNYNVVLVRNTLLIPINDSKWLGGRGKQVKENVLFSIKREQPSDR